MPKSIHIPNPLQQDAPLPMDTRGAYIINSITENISSAFLVTSFYPWVLPLLLSCELFPVAFRYNVQ